MNSACALVGCSAVVLASRAVTDRPNDPAAELIRARVLAENAPDRILGTPSRSGVGGATAHRDVAAFIAARAAARADAGATREPADDLAANGHDDPAPPADPAPQPEPAATELPPRPEARPRIVEDPVILGLSRVSRSKLGSRLFALFFVFVYVVILVQLIMSLLHT